MISTNHNELQDKSIKIVILEKFQSFSSEFIYTILFVLIIFTAMIKVCSVGEKRYFLQVYGQYNGKKVSTKNEWDSAQKEIFREFMRINLGLVALFFLLLMLSALKYNLLN